MANEEHLQIIRQGADVWNEWRKKNPELILDFRGANLRGADLSGANLSGANLRGALLDDTCLHDANLTKADFTHAFLHRANLREADLTRAQLGEADLTEADLRGAHLGGANLSGALLRRADPSGAFLRWASLSLADLCGAKLGGANLERTNLVEADLTDADLTGCHIYGVSAWGLKLQGAKQQDLVIASYGEPEITVDNIEVAQFVYLIQHNEKIRSVIDTITSKAVLILGRFSEGRKPVLNSLRNALRDKGFLPIVFDFERPKERDFTETIMTLAGMSCFVIADITKPKSAPLELQAAVPNYMIPFVPILQDGEPPFSMFLNLQTKYHWVLDVLGYNSPDTLIEVLEEAVIIPALKKRDELEQEKIRKRPTRHVDDYRKLPRIKPTN